MNNIEQEFFVIDAYAKLKSILKNYQKKDIRVAYSGGADSDTVMFILRKLGYNISGVFYDTGLEYAATWKHIEYMRTQGYIIDIQKAKMSIPTSNTKYGSPFISKRVSEYISRLQSHNFNFRVDGLLDFETLWKKYPNAKSALRWWTNSHKGRSNNIKWNSRLKEFLIENPPQFSISDKCCMGAKKKPAMYYTKTHNIKLMLLGIRRAEGGARLSYKSCYLPAKTYSYGMFFPLFWWKKAEKQAYDTYFKIKHSDCYEVYSLSRTGCAGCPFGRKFENELEIIKKYEPRLLKGINNIFADSYSLTRKYTTFKLNK